MVALGLAVAALSVFGPGAAVGESTHAPPPVPACYHSSGGPCEGIFLKSAVGISRITTAGKGGVISLKGPAPLQFKKSVSCGDAGCLYNHLNRVIGAGATVVAGCGTNQTTCKVRVLRGSSAWASVLVNQNDYPRSLFLLWLSPRGPR